MADVQGWVGESYDNVYDILNSTVFDLHTLLNEPLHIN